LLGFTRRTENDLPLLEGGEPDQVQVYSRLQPVQVDGLEHLLFRGSEAYSSACEQTLSRFQSLSFDRLQTYLDLRENSETCHSEEVARMFEAAEGGASHGREEKVP
jgi:hypothetical protein